MAEHTPTPWRLKHSSADRVIAGDPSEPFTVANCWSGPFAPERHVARANAALIVRAVNCHGELLAACRSALECLERLEPLDDTFDAQHTAGQLRSAVAKAEGG